MCSFLFSTPEVPDDAETNRHVPEECATSMDPVPGMKRAKMEEDSKLAQQLAEKENQRLVEQEKQRLIEKEKQKLVEQEKEQKKTLQKYYQEMSKCR